MPLRSLLHGGAGGGLDVRSSDEDVVARLLAVAADLGRACRRGSPSAEDRDDAGLARAVLAGPVDVGVAEDLRLEAVDDPVVVEVLLDRELRAAVGRDGVGRMATRARDGRPRARRRARRRSRRRGRAATPARRQASKSFRAPEDVGARVVERDRRRCGAGRSAPRDATRSRSSPRAATARGRLRRCRPGRSARPRGAFSRLPVERSSTTTTRWPSARCRARHVRPDESGAAGDENVHRSFRVGRR